MIRCGLERCAGIIGVFLVAGPLSAQPERALPPADAKLSTEFSQLISVRELSDGRVLLTDEIENSIVVADFSHQTVQPTTRTGRGPGEYSRVGRLFSLGNDTTVMKDPSALRILRFVRDSALGDTWQAGPRSLIKLRDRLVGADRAGNLFFLGYDRGSNGASALRDSVLLLRHRPAQEVTEVLVRLRPEMTSESDGAVEQTARARPSGGGARRPAMIGMRVEDVMVAFPDSWVAIVRVSPYRIDWCRVGGECAIGPELEGVQPFSDASKSALLHAAHRVGEWRHSTELATTIGWPSTRPAFSVRPLSPEGATAWPTPEGNVLVERLRIEPSPQVRYDVIDRSGKRVLNLRLGHNQRVVGFGRRHVYVVTKDADGLERLSRHPWDLTTDGPVSR